MDPSAYTRMADLQADHWWFSARRSIIADQISRLGLPPSAKILDAGCGPGANLEMLTQFGDVVGMEMDDGARAFAQNTGLTIHPGHLPGGCDFAAESFDFIGAFDVIEHIEDDHGALREIGSFLRPNGTFLATVPANPWMWSVHDTHHHHFRRYTKASLTHLIKGSGLHIDRITYFNTLLYPIAAAVRLAKKAVSGADGQGSDDRMPAGLLNAALRTVFAAEKPILRATNLPFGVSLMVLARKAE